MNELHECEEEEAAVVAAEKKQIETTTIRSIVMLTFRWVSVARTACSWLCEWNDGCLTTSLHPSVGIGALDV